MSEWYYANEGAQVGPVTTEYLRRLIAEGRIARESLVWNESMSEWKPAASVTELAGNATPLFSVAIWKLVLMTLATLGVYQIYWGFRHWDAIRTRTGEKMMPLLRGIFAIFFFRSLVTEVNGEAAVQKIGRELPATGLTVLFVLLVFTQRLPDPLWLVSFLMLVPVGLVQQLANEVNQKAAPLADRNDRIRRWNWLAVFLGLPFFAFAVYATFFPE